MLKAVLVQLTIGTTVSIWLDGAHVAEAAHHAGAGLPVEGVLHAGGGGSALGDGRDHARVAVGEEPHGGAALVEGGDAFLLVDVLEVVDLLEGLDGDLPVAADDQGVLLEEAQVLSVELGHLAGDGAEPLDQRHGVGVLVHEDPAAPDLAAVLGEMALLVGDGVEILAEGHGDEVAGGVVGPAAPLAAEYALGKGAAGEVLLAEELAGSVELDLGLEGAVVVPGDEGGAVGALVAEGADAHGGVAHEDDGGVAEGLKEPVGCPPREAPPGVRP